ncbi:sigma-54-dependent Fis family transcriptional regulator [Paenibacillus doosanensis]|uniref:Acetoin dehydrogenase operon transcriptional activator AcoR n=1 Tax=Paenibacillus konkukensis TaxID=2020716 RepID=A0ABY4RIJ3_9BACL|nr:MULTISPECIES: sigma-54-dependent Fis family transcriptional regulator [Paenibacillus]MCS7463934.1 sigma-54-dependent Fis family transcriptional regulator [Paenibacillus doosanensis]UQZ82269.1 Acetoin dehydrogenase operon transcriptional activator AcoR [Paenibacillus konkukensis]
MTSLGLNEQTEIVANSWKRCQQYGLKPHDHFDDQLMTEQRIREIIGEHQLLIRHASQLLGSMERFIHQSGQAALLIDAGGNIIYSVGEPLFSKQAEQVQLQVGANWEERRKGTNAIGAALLERVPVRVHAAEHYSRQHSFLTCASSPIFSPSGELLGVINFSGRQESYNPYTLTLATMIADALQNRLLIEEVKQEQLITLKELEYSARSHPLPLLSLDADNRIIRANQAALRALGQDVVGKEFTGIEGFAVEALHDGRHTIKRSVAVQKKTVNVGRLYTFDDIAGDCPSLLQKKELAGKAALTDFPVLLLGESGTGKELFAQSIHTASLRSEGPFIAVNCGAIPDTLVESELFGYERGAFTGANREGSIGKFEAANKGTIFLDEIGDMSLRAQAALLRVLQERIVTPVGSTKSRRIDTRIIAATHKNLTQEVKEGRFRADLYYRLKGIQLTLPALRERTDIVMLAAHLLHKHGYPCCRLTESAGRKLLLYSWPGNVRELSSALIQAAFLAEGGPIAPEHLLLEEADAGDGRLSGDQLGAQVPTLKAAEVGAIKRALQVTGWNVSKAAELLQIGRTTLYRKIEEYEITRL